MRKPLIMLAALVSLVGCETATASPTDIEPQFSKTAVGGRAGALGVVYVSSQGLYYDTFVSAEKLPQHGRFQKLEAGVTEFGPGQPGYLGGRWWIDVNGNDMMDAGDKYLLCPLLGPGRTTP